MRFPATRKIRIALVPLVAIALLVACATKVERTAVDKTIDLSGYWNDTDSRLVSESMVADCLSAPWASRAEAKLGRVPTVIVGSVQNKSSEHLNTQTFVKDLERAIVNSGTIDLVASRDERSELRAERRDQQQNATMDSMKSMGNEQGADFMLQGQINSILDAANNQQVRFYQVELELVDLESNRKVWIGQHKEKKLVTRPKMKF